MYWKYRQLSYHSAPWIDSNACWSDWNGKINSEVKRWFRFLAATAAAAGAPVQSVATNVNNDCKPNDDRERRRARDIVTCVMQCSSNEPYRLYSTIPWTTLNGTRYSLNTCLISTENRSKKKNIKIFILFLFASKKIFDTFSVHCSTTRVFFSHPLLRFISRLILIYW